MFYFFLQPSEPGLSRIFFCAFTMFIIWASIFWIFTIIFVPIDIYRKPSIIYKYRFDKEYDKKVKIFHIFIFPENFSAKRLMLTWLKCDIFLFSNHFNQNFLKISSDLIRDFLVFY